MSSLAEVAVCDWSHPARALTKSKVLHRSSSALSPREVAIDEKLAVLVEANGKATVGGTVKGAYFLKPTRAPGVCEKSAPLTFLGSTVYRVTAGRHFDLSEWKADGGTAYSLSVRAGKIESTHGKRAVY